ncbi:MAG: O-antigen ligase family protein, partial [Actinomycetota bacterium]|nr:O-antigen ligase family protein [Actinomycetota bacterium]
MREAILARGPVARRVVLTSLVVGVPVVFLRATLDPFNVPKLSLLASGVLLVLAIRVIEMIQGTSWRGIERLWIPAALLSGPLLLSWLLSPYRSWAVFGLEPRFEGIVPYLFVILFGLLLNDAFRGRGPELALALCWSGAVVGGYAVIQTIGMDPFEWSLFGAPTEAVSTTGNPNFTGGFLGIVLPVGLALAVADRGRRRVILRLMVPIALGWIAARSQGGWAAGIAGCALVTGHLVSSRYRRARLLGATVAIMAALATVGVVIIAMIQPSGRFTPDAALVRARWWQAAIGMGMEHPIVGRGPNSFAMEGVSHRPLEDALVFGFDFPDDPHSIPLAMFANLGLPGLMGFIGILGWAIWFFARARAPSLLQVGFLAAVVAYFVQATVSIDELTLRTGLWIGLAGLGTFQAAPDREQRPASKKSRARRPATRVARRSPLRSPALVGVVGFLTAVSLLWPASIIVADA